MLYHHADQPLIGSWIHGIGDVLSFVRFCLMSVVEIMRAMSGFGYKPYKGKHLGIGSQLKVITLNYGGNDSWLYPYF